MKTLTDTVEIGKWYRKELEGGISSNGKPYSITFRKGNVNKLLVFFIGGGLSWNEETASNPVKIGAMIRKKETFYVSDVPPWQLKLVTHYGMLNTNDKRNPFSDWHILVIPYATADFHIGNNEYHYTDAKGNNKVMYHKGSNNVNEALKVLKKFVPETPDSLLITGLSAGGFGCLAHSQKIKSLYPDCKNIVFYIEGSYLYSSLWPSITKNIWKVNSDLESHISSNDLIIDLFHYAKEHMPSHTIFLHSNSVWDIELVKMMNKLNHGTLSISPQALQEFHDNLIQAVRKLKNEIPNYYYYLTDYGKNKKNGTTPHTFSGTPKLFYGEMQDNMSIANWLTQTIAENSSDIGVRFTENRNY